jgi:hypothetical protein
MSARDEALTKLGLREIEVSIVLTVPVGMNQRTEDVILGQLLTYAADLFWVKEAGIRKINLPVDDLLAIWNEVQLAADKMLGIDNGGTWGSFTCSEIEALAGVFAAAGRQDVAAFIISEHAESDEDDDLHTKKEES